MSLTKSLLACVLMLVLGYAYGRYAAPEKVREQIVEKEVVRREVRVIEREKKLPDGTTEKEKIIEEIAQDEKEKQSDTDLQKIRPKWRTSIVAAYEQDYGRAYGAQVEYRFLGPMFVGAFALESGTAGINLGIEF